MYEEILSKYPTATVEVFNDIVDTRIEHTILIMNKEDAISRLRSGLCKDLSEVVIGIKGDLTMNKNERAESAANWLHYMTSKHMDKIKHSIGRTEACTDVTLESIVIGKPMLNNTITRVFKNDVCNCAHAAVSHNSTEKVCILNFASYKNPGGGFLKGANAQEEALCGASGLYPVLLSQTAWYEKHRNENVDGCYSNDYIYSENVPFIHNGKLFSVDVLTIAAPNTKATRRKDVNKIMKERMEVAIKVAISKGVTVMLLGAFGCGAFGNDAKFVAEEWKRLINKYYGYFREVVHPIIDVATYKVFKDVYR